MARGAGRDLSIQLRMIETVTNTIRKVRSEVGSQMQQMKASTGRVSQGFENVTKKIINVKNAIAGFALVKGFQGLLGTVAELGDKFDKMSAKLGVSTKFLQELDFASNLAGSSIEEIQTGIRRLAKSASDVERGLSTATDAFADLGVNVFDNNGKLKDTEVLFGEVVTALGNVESSTKRVALSQEILGRSGTALLPLVRDGADAFEKARIQAGKLGVVMDEKTLKATVDYTDSMFRLKAAFKGQLIEAFIPTLRSLSDTVEGFINRGGFDSLTKQINALVIAGKVLFATYAANKFVNMIVGFKAVGTQAEIAAIKTARATAVMNALKFVGLLAVLAVVQIAFDTLIKSQEAISAANENMADKIGGSSKKTVVRLLELRKEFERLKATGQDATTTTGQWGVSITRTSDAMNKLHAETVLLQGASFDSNTGRRRDINTLEAELKILNNLSEKKKEDAEGAGAGPNPLQIEQAKEAQQSLDDQVEAIRVANLQRSFEGRMQLINEQETLLLENKRITEEQITIIEAEFSAQRLDNTTAFQDEKAKLLDDERKKQAALDKADQDRRKKINEEADKLEKQRLATRKANLAVQAQGQRQLTDALISEGSRGLQALVGNEKTAKKIAFVTSLIQGALAVQRTLANPPGPPFTIPGSIAVGLLAASNSAFIASQAFATGGFPQGRNAMITVNESGQEAVLNSRATTNLGVGGVNALNSGQTPSTSITNQISYNPSITVTGEATEGVIDALQKDKEAFADFFSDEVVGKGYLERNL